MNNGNWTTAKEAYNLIREDLNKDIPGKAAGAEKVNVWAKLDWVAKDA